MQNTRIIRTNGYLRPTTSFHLVDNDSEHADCVIHGTDAWGDSMIARLKFNPPPREARGIRTGTHRSLFRFAKRKLCFASIDSVVVVGKYTSATYVEEDPQPLDVDPRQHND